MEINMQLPNLACFLPPNRLPGLVGITAISAEYAADMNKKLVKFNARA